MPFKLAERYEILAGFQRSLIEDSLLDCLPIAFCKYIRVKFALDRKDSVCLLFVCLPRADLSFDTVGV